MWRKARIARNGVESGGAQGCVDALEKLQEDEADGISLGAETIAARAGQLFDQAFDAELGEIIPKRGQAVALGSGTQGGNGAGVDFRGAEGPGCWDLSEPDQGVHQRELSGIVELEAGDALAGRG